METPAFTYWEGVEAVSLNRVKEITKVHKGKQKASVCSKPAMWSTAGSRICMPNKSHWTCKNIYKPWKIGSQTAKHIKLLLKIT